MAVGFLFSSITSILVLNLYVQVYAQIYKRENQGVSYARFVRNPSARLNSFVLDAVRVSKLGECTFQCINNRDCFSVNFGGSHDGTHLCELINSDRFNEPGEFLPNEDFDHYHIKSECEASISLCGDKEVCIPNYKDGSVRCNCASGYTGKPCEPIPKNCAQLLQDGATSSGVYTINLDGGEPMKVMCDMTTDGGGWTVFQTRLDGSVDFFLGWESYKNGFGDPKGEFWLGNDNLHRLTSADEMMLRVDMEDFEGDIRYAEYTRFEVADIVDKYRLSIGGYSGTAGDSLLNGHNNMQFTTKDSDNDIDVNNNCAANFKGAWWYWKCHDSNLNGFYHGGPHPNSRADGVHWLPFRGHVYSLKRTEMKIRPRPKK